MHGTYLIEVAHKPGIQDPLAEGIADDLKQVGAPAYRTGRRGILKVSTSKLYRLVGKLTAEERVRIGKDLLSDPVTEEFRDGTNPSPLSRRGDSQGEGLKAVVVDVWYKQGVTDAVGETVLKGLQDMNLSEIQDVRTGMRYRFFGLKEPKVAEKLALAVLINPLIHDRIIHAD